MEASAQAFAAAFPDDSSTPELLQLVRDVLSSDPSNIKSVEHASEVLNQALADDHIIAGRQLRELAELGEPDSSRGKVGVIEWLSQTVALHDRHVRELTESRRSMRSAVEALRIAAARVGPSAVQDAANAVLEEAEGITERQDESLGSKTAAGSKFRTALNQLAGPS